MATRKRADKFPLWWHTGAKAWAKKIRGRFYYFGPDRDAALIDYAEVLDALKAGREPRRKAGALTLVELVNSFLTAKRERVDSGELTAAMWGEYFHMSERILTTIGRERVVVDLRPEDFGRLRKAATEKLGPVALTKFITMARTLFGYAFKAELIDVPVRFGDRFDKPPKRVLRLERAVNGPKLIAAADLWTLIDAADVQLRAMLYLGLNCGFGQADCAALQWRDLERRAAWVDFPRVKSGVARRAPLWPETITALAAVHPIRPEPKDPADAGCVFITVQGNRWCCYRDPGNGKRGHSLDAVARAFRRLCTSTGVKVPGGPYVMRHIFRTIANETKDRPAIDLIMGHADHTQTSYYREQIGDDRLEAVVNHVRNWLLVARK